MLESSRLSEAALLNTIFMLLSAIRPVSPEGEKRKHKLTVLDPIISCDDRTIRTAAVTLKI